MTPQEKKSYLVEIKARYKKACKKEQGRILDEFCAVCHYHRKYAIRILSKPIHRPKKKPGPVCYYDEAVLNVLRPIWIASDQLCSKRLKVALKFWLPYDEHEKGILSDSVRKKVLSMSASTIDRLLKKVRFEHGKKGLSGTKPGTLLKTQIAIKTNHWDVTRPGYVEADTVAHCGNSLSGNFIWSLTFTDIFSGWTENRATWNKGSQGVIDQIKDIESFIPFQLLGFDCDNGSEFLNHHLWRYFSDRPQPVQFTRSRPYKKNDKAHVEQKNWSHVRQILGYDRMEKIELVDMINDLYKNEWSDFQNHFCPTMKLMTKEKINSKYRRKYEDPQTPYHRIIACEHIDEATKSALVKKHDLLNPFELKRVIHVKLGNIFEHVIVTNNVRQRI